MASSINLTVFYEEETFFIQTYPYEYRSLMALLYDKIYIGDNFGECKGMGRCGTCIIEILNPNKGITFFDRNERATLEKMGIEKQNTHLACQIEADEHIDGLEIKILYE
jgi:2Fe-2S ferredoxin